jgi:hypothetical protein
MPDPERLLNTLRRACFLFRETPGRTGRLVHLPAGAEVLVAGDLHGDLDNFRKVLHLADLAHHPGRQFILQEVIHSTQISQFGGDRSHQLLDLIAALKCQYPQRVHFLLGNHELAQLTERPVAKLLPGETEVVNLNEAFRHGVEASYGMHAELIYQSYLELFQVVPLALRTANRVFISHSLPAAGLLETFRLALLEQEITDPVHLEPGGAVYALVWGRDVRKETARAFLDKVDADWLISGHIPCERGYEFPNDHQLILDGVGSPAACCLFPTDHPLTQEDLAEGIRLLS